MNSSFDRMQRACGYLVLNDVNAFVYCCRTCPCEYESILDLEAHILYDHLDVKEGIIESVFVPGDVFEAISEVQPMKINQNIILTQEIKRGNETDSDISQEFEPEHDHDSISDGPQCVFIEESHGLENDEVQDVKMVLSTEIPNEASQKKRKEEKSPMPNPYKYYCDMCSFSEINFNRKTELLLHMQEHHMPAKVRKTCPICGETPRCFLSHMKVQHDIQKPYTCNHCNRGFAQESKLQDHERIHTGERPHLCPTCGNIQLFFLFYLLSIQLALNRF